MPIHNILSGEKDKKMIKKLVNTKKVRKILWTFRMLLIIDEIIS